MIMPRKSAHKFIGFFGRFSLRQRYLAVAIGVFLIILFSAMISEYYVAQTQEQSTRNIENRNLVQHISRSLRNSVWGTEYALQAFILTPTAWYRDAVQDRVKTALASTQKLAEIQWLSNQGLDDSIARIDNSLLELNHAMNTLMDIRSDVERLFPAARLMDNTLAPAHSNFLTAAQLAIQELEIDHSPQNQRIHQAFQDALQSWLQMTSSFRLYVVRQAGIYSDTEKGLNDAAHDISLHYQKVQEHLQQLRELEKGFDFPLQAAESLQQMTQSTNIWYQAYQEFRTMRKTGHWRADFPIIEEKIQPLFAEIWNGLDRIDSAVESAAVQDVNLWTHVARSLRTNILLLSLLALAVIITGYIFFQRTVLNPLSTMTKVMKQVAHGHYQESMPRPNSLEARDLVDAFQHMQHKIEERQNELRHQTLHDALTGLPNRLLLNDRMQQSLLISARDRNPLCLLMMDLDRFKEINDTLGHHVGDEVLREVSQRLQELLRRSDTVARLGGDEFAVLLPETSSLEAQSIAQKIAGAFEQSIPINDQQLLVGTSIGIAVYPDHGDDVETLVKRADVAMYVAKHSGLTYSVYSPKHDQHSVSRLAMISELRYAINNDELELYYQPKIAFGSGELVGAEALLRWPRWSNVPVEHLITTAEQTGLIRPLTHWVLRHSLHQYLEWHKFNLHMPVAVNLSTWNLEHSDIDEVVGQLLDEYGVTPDFLEFEITENAMLKNPERAMSILRRLSRLGILLSVDDYGTGFSSLAYLKQMPVRQIKIDRSFVMDMLEDENDAVIVRSTIDLAHNLGLEVIAEGVENAEIWDLLEILGCDIAQGYHIARPMPASEFLEWMRERAQRLADDSQGIA